MQTKIENSLTEASQPSLDEAMLTITDRNRLLDCVLNPDNTLPNVSLRPTPLSTGPDDKNCIIYNGGQAIGYIAHKLPNPYSGKRFATVQGVGLSGDFIGGGRHYGRAAYLEVLKSLPKGIALRNSDAGLTKGSLQVWRWLEERGVAVSNLPDGSIAAGEDGHYIGYKFRTIFGGQEEAVCSSGQDEAIKQSEELGLLARALKRFRRPKY